MVEAFEIPSGSMEDTLLVGDSIVVDKLAYAPHAGPWRVLLPYRDVVPGDIAIFRSPEDPSIDLVKRVLATGGNTFRMEAGKVYRDGLEVLEPYVRNDGPIASFGSWAPARLAAGSGWGPLTVPPGAFVALGDNRDRSRDSRWFGPVPEALVKGRPLFVYWSREAPADVAAVRAGPLSRFVDRLLHFADRTRWGRTFRAVR